MRAWQWWRGGEYEANKALAAEHDSGALRPSDSLPAAEHHDIRAQPRPAPEVRPRRQLRRGINHERNAALGAFVDKIVESQRGGAVSALWQPACKEALRVGPVSGRGRAGVLEGARRVPLACKVEERRRFAPWR